MYIFWAILGIFFLYLDLIKKSMIRLVLATTFLFCSIIAYKFPNNFLYQIYALFAFGGLFYALIKSCFNKEFDDIKKEKSLKEYVGKIAFVKKDIGKTLSIDGLGYIEFDNQLWSAKSVDDKLIKAGQKVEIVSKENKIMNVKVINNAKE